MSKGNGWIPLDKELIKSLPKDGRPYTILEAMFSYTCDIDEGNKWTIKGYSKLWGWSRCKVRNFVNSIRHPNGHSVDTLKTHLRHTVHFIDKGLWDIKDTLKTPFRHPLDTPLDPTIYPNPNPNPKPKKKHSVKKFKKPSLEDVKRYCLERENKVSPEKWLDYYISNGWKVGKNPMKDWKASVRTWERNNGRGGQSNGKSGFKEARESGKTDWLS